jgi:hypothetical protein
MPNGNVLNIIILYIIIIFIFPLMGMGIPAYGSTEEYLQFALALPLKTRHFGKIGVSR